ncbi:MAG: DNA repair protein RecO [Chloroflexota bacterium]|nr:DNA repair protein RecO [Chloroflexota bacterium]
MRRVDLQRLDATLVLGLRDLGEADRLVFLYARDRGRFSAVARSGRRPASRLAGHLQLFAKVAIELVPTRSLDIITSARSLADRPRLAAGRRFAAASRVIEFLRRATAEEDPDPGLFDLADGTLELIDRRERISRQLWQFELAALDRLGLAPVLFDCALCNRALNARDLWFDPQAGGAICEHCPRSPLAARISERTLKALRFLQEARLGEADKLGIDPAIREQITLLLDRILQVAVGSIRPGPGADNSLGRPATGPDSQQ